jgi:hypothetical protein
MPVARRDVLTTPVARKFAAALAAEDEAERLAKKGEQLQSAQEAFVAGFARSRKGNLWRRVTIRSDGVDIEQLSVAIFRQNDKYKLSISDSDGPHFGRATYDTEQDALIALFWALRHFFGEAELV